MRINLWWSERRGEGRFSFAPTDYGNILFINAHLGLHCFPSTICFSIVLSSFSFSLIASYLNSPTITIFAADGLWTFDQTFGIGNGNCDPFLSTSTLYFVRRATNLIHRIFLDELYSSEFISFWTSNKAKAKKYTNSNLFQSRREEG